MPMYDFKCPTCGKVFEAIVPNSDVTEVEHEPCAVNAVKLDTVPLVARRNPDYGIQK